MRHLPFAAVLVCACAAAQPFNVESFDVSGLPARPQTSAERDLARMIGAHKRGDAAGAAQIQRKLATYYRAKGDRERAIAAEQRANGAGLPMMMGPVPRKAPEPKAPEYGLAPLPAPAQDQTGYGNIPLYQPEGATPTVQPPAAPAAPAAEVQEAAPQPSEVGGKFYVMQGQTLHTWEFRPDGTFEHGWLAGRTANFEAGTFSTAGGYMTLQVLRRSAPQAARETRRMRIGSRGGEGFTLDGMVLSPKRP